MSDFSSLQTGRETTFEERATWGICPVCGAQPGEWCLPEVGLVLGFQANGERPQKGSGVHLGRLNKAPRRIKLVSDE